MGFVNSGHPLSKPLPNQCNNGGSFGSGLAVRQIKNNLIRPSFLSGHKKKRIAATATLMIVGASLFCLLQKH